jgi:hypothetical protein
MTVTLSAEIDGKHVPLTDCDWVLFGSCGCPFGVSMAATNLGVRAADEDAAWRCLFVTKREIDRAKSRGDRLELMSHERYCREVSDRMKVRCDHA